MYARGGGPAGLAVAALLVCAPGASAATAVGDFDGDRRQDLVVGAPGDTVDGHPSAGTVQVFYGTKDGPGTDRDKILTRISFAIPDDAESFGNALAVGDIDGDGFADLVVGAPGADESSTDHVGAVGVFFGGPKGLRKQDTQGAPVRDDEAEDGDIRGSAVAVGDFDGDGFGDVAAGEPGAPGGAAEGRVLVWPGTRHGLKDEPPEEFNQDVNLEGDPADGELFGLSLATGDLDDDGRDDLVIGVPGDVVGGDIGAGSVNVLYGRPDGLSRAGDQLLNQDSTEAFNGFTEDMGVAEAGDQFGASVAVGDVTGDGFADLAVGSPLESIGAATAAGSANLLLGGARGLTLERTQVFNQDAVEIPGPTPGSDDPAETNETNDLYGLAVAIGDVDGDGFGDAIAGIPGEAPSFEGGIEKFSGGDFGLTGSALDFIGGAEIFSPSPPFDSLSGAGTTLATGRFDKGKVLDVAVGAPESDGLDGVTVVPESGAAAVLFGPFSSLIENHSFAFDRGSPGVAGAPVSGAGFGSSLGTTRGR